MYLKKLYHHNKYRFAAIALFIIGQLFINAKRGMVASPFYHYGMYSEVMKEKSSYDIFEISVNGEILHSKDFSPQQWDKIMQPVIYFSKHKEWNAGMYNEVHRLTGINDSSKYMIYVPKKAFTDWYRQYLSVITGKEVLSFNIQQKTYTPAR